MRHVDINPIPRHPVFTPKQAVAYAKSQVSSPDKDYTALCLHFSAWVYGFKNSGVRSAADFWKSLPKSQKRPDDRTPPIGALACWLGGSKGFGHISPVVGYNKAGEAMVASNDVKRTGKIDVIPLSLVEKEWGQKYVGWAKPYFPLGVKDDRKPPAVYESADDWGEIHQGKLRPGVKNSKSVRRLQKRLGLKPTGNYTAATAKAAAAWKKKRGFEEDGDRWSMTELNALLGAHYFAYKSK